MAMVLTSEKRSRGAMSKRKAGNEAKSTIRHSLHSHRTLATVVIALQAARARHQSNSLCK